MPEFDLQLLHLGLHQQGHQRFDLPLLHGGQVLGKAGKVAREREGPPEAGQGQSGRAVGRRLTGFKKELAMVTTPRVAKASYS